MDCLIRKRRLLYFSRVAQADFPALHAALLCKTKNGNHMPWLDMLANDIHVLKRHTSDLSAMPSPDQDLSFYWHFATKQPHAWRRIVNKYFTERDDTSTCNEVRGESSHSDAVHRCSKCSASFLTHKQLSVHYWAKHQVKSKVRDYIGDISVCPTCGTNFHTRVRLVKHLSVTVVSAKNKTQTCAQAFLGSNPNKVPKEEFERLETRDRERE